MKSDPKTGQISIDFVNFLRRFCRSFLSNKNTTLFFYSRNLVGGTFDTSQVRGEQGGIREASGRHLGSGSHLGGIWEAPWKHLGSVWEASTLGFPPWSERCLLETPGVKIQADHQCMFLPVCFLLVMCWSLLGDCMGNNNGNVT